MKRRGASFYLAALAGGSLLGGCSATLQQPSVGTLPAPGARARHSAQARATARVDVARRTREFAPLRFGLGASSRKRVRAVPVEETNPRGATHRL